MTALAKTFRDKTPEPIRFMTSGLIGSVIFYILNEAIVRFNPIESQKITVAWFLSYVISIWIQHALHATLVYGWVFSYWKGLLATYTGYSLALFASVPINAVLVNYLRATVSEAWIGTLVLTGMANYFLLGKLLSAGEKDNVNEKRE